MRRSRQSLLFLLLGAICLNGCGASSDKPAEAPEQSAGDETPDGGVKVVDASTLPALNDYLPALDGGRIELAAPEGWKPLSRDNTHLVRFIVLKNDANNLPRILVKGAEAGSLPDPVTRENVAEFTKAIADELADKKGIDEQPKAVILGDNAFARYVTIARTKSGREVKRQILETVQAGRRYTLTLEVYDKVDKTNRDFAYAVAAGLKFHSKASASTPAPMTESPPAPVDEAAPVEKTETK